jgi:hypothetical protein
LRAWVFGLSFLSSCFFLRLHGPAHRKLRLASLFTFILWIRERMPQFLDRIAML